MFQLVLSKSPINVSQGIEEMCFSLKLSSSSFIDVLKIILKNFFILYTLRRANHNFSITQGQSEMQLFTKENAFVY